MNVEELSVRIESVVEIVQHDVTLEGKGGSCVPEVVPVAGETGERRGWPQRVPGQARPATATQVTYPITYFKYSNKKYKFCNSLPNCIFIANVWLSIHKRLH